MSKVHETVHCLPTAVFYEYFNDEQRIFCLLQFFPDVAQNFLMIT